MKNILTLLSILALTLTSCHSKKENTSTNEATISVKVGGATDTNPGEFVTASGKIEAENSANVSTRMMGYVTKVHVKTGQKVTAGQLLVNINNSDLQAKKAQAEAGVLQATAAYANAKKDFDRFTVLFNQQSASQKELDDMTSRFEMAKAALEGAKQMRNEVLAQFTYANITAPFSGEVTNTFVKEGDMANPGMPLLSMEGETQLQVNAWVSESDIALIQNGMAVKVFVKSANQELSGKVTEVSGSAKNTGGQYAVTINLTKPGKTIRSGMFVNVQFPIANQKPTVASDKVLVPESALVKQGQLTGIYTVGTNHKAILRWLRLGKNYGSQVEVLSGLSANETYILSAEGKLYNGATITIQ